MNNEPLFDFKSGFTSVGIVFMVVMLLKFFRRSEMRKGNSLLTKDEMAYIYAGLIFQPTFNFSDLNAKIIKQWSRTALLEIKRKAWCLAEKLSNWEKSIEQIKEIINE